MQRPAPQPLQQPVQAPQYNPNAIVDYNDENEQLRQKCLELSKTVTVQHKLLKKLTKK
jgi:hypothetical protein